jgi:cell division protein FtsW (lipid II flippase)
MEKKLSPDQDTIQGTAKNEPEPEPELESKSKIESESKIEAESTDTSEIPPPTPVISEEQQNITKKRTNMLFWMRFGFAIIGGAIATFLFEEIDGNEERRWTSIIFMIVLFIITCFIAKGMKINFPKADRKKLVTTGMGSFVFLYLFAWIMTYTLLNLPREDFSLPFT